MPKYLSIYKNYLYLGVMLFLISSCNTEKSDKFEKPEISLDSTAIEKIFADSTLSIMNPNEVLAFSKDFNDSSRFINVIRYLPVLDSIKKTGTYNKYLESLDLGMIADIKAVNIKDIKWDKNTTLKLWGLSYHSYEACPYSSGMGVFLSVFENKLLKKTMPFAYLESMADAPFYLTTKTISMLTKEGNILIKEYNTNGGVNEQDVAYIEKDSVELKFNVLEF